MVENVVGQIDDILGQLDSNGKDQWIISREQLEEWKESLIIK